MLGKAGSSLLAIEFDLGFVEGCWPLEIASLFNMEAVAASALAMVLALILPLASTLALSLAPALALALTEPLNLTPKPNP